MYNQKVTNSRLEGTELLEAFNAMGHVCLLQLKLELLEFYYYVGRLLMEPGCLPSNPPSILDITIRQKA